MPESQQDIGIHNMQLKEIVATTPGCCKVCKLGILEYADKVVFPQSAEQIHGNVSLEQLFWVLVGT